MESFFRCPILAVAVAVAAAVVVVVRAEHDSYKPYLMVQRRAFNGVGFASYGSPVQSFGGNNGQMSVFGYGLLARRHALYKRDVDSVAKRVTEPSVINAVSSLLYRNDTMCLGLAVCRDAREDPKSASLLKDAFHSTSFLQGVNFVQYAIAHAVFVQESCERAFQPCGRVQPNLHKALSDVKMSMKTRLMAKKVLDDDTGSWK